VPDQTARPHETAAPFAEPGLSGVPPGVGNNGPPMGSPFSEETAVRRVADGRYEATIDEAWNLRPLPQGGIVTAVACRAMAADLQNPEERLRTLHTTFVAQVAHGPVVVDVRT